MPFTPTFTTQQLSTGHNALMDWSSFFKLTEPQSVTILRQRLSFPGDPAAFRETLGPFLMDLLARLVVYDGLLLDIKGHENFKNPLSEEAVRIAPVGFEREIYQRATERTLRSLNALQSTGANLTAQLENNTFFYGDIKRYADEVFGSFHELGSIADSNRSVPRVIFYLELSRHLGLQLFLSYEKRDLLRELEKLLWKDAFSVVANTIDTAMQQAQPVLDENEIRLQTPALVDLIIRRAFQHKISLEQSIIEVRNMQGAQEFRDLLAEVEQLMMLGDHAAMLRVQKLLAPLVKAANTWSMAADSEVRWRWQARVNKLPWIGDLLEALGIDAPAIPIKGKHRSYVQFVSEWYNVDPEEQR